MVEPHWTGTAHLFRDCYINSINIENRHDLNDTEVLTEESRIESQTVNTEVTPKEHAEEERSQSDDNEHETHLVEPTSREAPITTTEETQNEERMQQLRKINTVCFFYKKMACRHGMIGEECKVLHQPHAENIWKTQKDVAEHNAKATIPNSASILGPQGNVTTIDASEYISRTQGASKPHLRPRNLLQLHEQQINNKL